MTMRKTCARASTTGALVATVMALAGSVALADDLRLLVPLPVFYNENVEKFIDLYTAETGNTVIITASRGGRNGHASSDLPLTARESESNLVFGWTAGDWQKAFAGTDLSLTFPGSPLLADQLVEPETGTAILGAGFGSQVVIDEQAIGLTHPVDTINLPLIVAQPVMNSLSSSEQQAQDIADFIRLLRESSTGRKVLQSLTLLPNSQPSEGALKLYAASGDDGCGCDSRTGACDPDGFVLPGFDLAQRFGNSYHLPTGMNGDDGCGCDNGRIVRLGTQHISAGLIKEAERMLAGRGLDPSDAIYFACDPD